MTDCSGLERRYRELLALYPRAFRREHEQEMLAVLMAGATDGQRRPRLGETADLIKNAIWMQLRPDVRRSQPTVFWAVVLMWLCSVLRLLGVPSLPAVPGSVGFSLQIGISWGVFALLAWANGRGYLWGRLLFSVWFALHSLALFYDLTHLTASYSPTWTVIASMSFWLVELLAVLLILNRRSQPHYRHKPA